MAVKAGGHYRPALHTHCGLIQGDPLSPTIFNMVVDAVIRNCVVVVGDPQEGVGQEGLGTSIQDLLALFYADYALVASLESARFQGGGLEP